MKDKAIFIIVPLLIITVGIVLNFSGFLMGGPANTQNLIVTVVYLVAWIVLVTMSLKNKKIGILRCYFVFWTIPLFLAIIVAYVNVFEANVDWAIPFTILFLTQWYGIKFFVASHLTTSILIAIISLIMIIPIFVSLIKPKEV